MNRDKFYMNFAVGINLLCGTANALVTIAHPTWIGFGSALLSYGVAAWCFMSWHPPKKERCDRFVLFRTLHLGIVKIVSPNNHLWGVIVGWRDTIWMVGIGKMMFMRCRMQCGS